MPRYRCKCVTHGSSVGTKRIDDPEHVSQEQSGEQVSLSTRSSSMGALEDTPGPERAPQTERVNIHERAVRDSQSQVATTDAAGDTGSKTRCSESLGYEGLGAEQPTASESRVDLMDDHPVKGYPSHILSLDSLGFHSSLHCWRF
ncbi:hypothetical protein ACJ73_07833 [Blastomyces percursus]|uniref:Uncharacterized protein n=1 Tax=Blastomyces percursus TaxID=1658174 RepID=A0A1J9QXB2_9EURO|nr:hypothetical protein ACJ73_07833 [Blastomyces percursus]